MATILSELDGKIDDDLSHKILLIEEPEAHLHPQLQIKLLQYLQKKAKDDDIQIIVTTHSPTLTSAIDLHAVKVLSLVGDQQIPTFTTVANCAVSDLSKKFLERWLDITKSVLFFSKGLLFVEGIAEALIVKALAKTVLNDLQEAQPDQTFHTCLEEYGISIINLNGKFFGHFFSLFKGYQILKSGEYDSCEGIPIRCAGLTDNDPPKLSKPTLENPVPGTNECLKLIDELEAHSANCRLFSNLKTFEYDLAMEGSNLNAMAQVQLDLTLTDGAVKQQLQGYIKQDWTKSTPTQKADAAYWLLERLDKGAFAQALAIYIDEKTESLQVPAYIVKAIKWIIYAK